MIEIKLFPQDNGSVTFEAKRYDNNGEAASFTVDADITRQWLNRITTVKEQQTTLAAIAHLEKFASLMLK